MADSNQKKMGRPIVYDPDKPRRGHLLQLTDELWDALKGASDEDGGNITKLVEEGLRSLPHIAKHLKQ